MEAFKGNQFNLSVLEISIRLYRFQSWTMDCTSHDFSVLQYVTCYMLHFIFYIFEGRGERWIIILQNLRKFYKKSLLSIEKNRYPCWQDECSFLFLYYSLGFLDWLFLNRTFSAKVSCRRKFLSLQSFLSFKISIPSSSNLTAMKLHVSTGFLNSIHFNDFKNLKNLEIWTDHGMFLNKFFEKHKKSNVKFLSIGGLLEFSSTGTERNMPINRRCHSNRSLFWVKIFVDMFSVILVFRTLNFLKSMVRIRFPIWANYLSAASQHLLDHWILDLLYVNFICGIAKGMIQVYSIVCQILTNWLSEIHFLCREFSRKWWKPFFKDRTTNNSARAWGSSVKPFDFDL